jgi:hypothetical protein
MTPITKWERFDEEKNTWKHNHIEERLSAEEIPTPKSDEQKRSWPKGRWRKKFKYLDKGRIL